MADRKKWIVVTTINPPTRAIEHISALCGEGWSAVVVGDTKTPADWAAPRIDYLSVARQKELFGEYADAVPYRHYCRKNLGYLYAISRGAEFILETDDDNIPYPTFGAETERLVAGRPVARRGWVNVYQYFTEALIWPRGLPLDEIHTVVPAGADGQEHDCPVQQYLADTDPDVDAIYRLLFRDPLDFWREAPVILSEGTWVPFNSQNTLFFREAFPLLYLPCHVSFRMTDIWRSFVAQRALWVHGYRLAFKAATVKQIRNEHDLMKDFSQEVVGYTENRRIAELLDEACLRLTPAERTTLAATARTLWSALHAGGIIPDQELPVIDGWFDAVRKASAQGGSR